MKVALRVSPSPSEPRPVNRGAFNATDLMVIVATVSVLLALVVPFIVRARATSRLNVCLANLKQVNRAVLEFAEGNSRTLPNMTGRTAPGGWWSYKEQVKPLLGLNGPASTADKVFACPDDRGYGDGSDETTPFCRSAKYSFTSYVFNGVNVPGVPSIDGRKLDTIREPARTLLVMEWTAHAPLSWHRSRTGDANTPFYNDAESVVGFVDGHVALTRIFYDGLNAAYTRDPGPEYSYKYSGD
jgi:prepilin-type processing-associated H-X9-DG protein